MPPSSRAQREMIDVISSIDSDWPCTLLYLSPNGADIKIQAGTSDNREREQLVLAAMYLLFLESQLDGDLSEVANRVAEVAEELRGDDEVFEIQWGGSLDDGG